MRCPARFSTAFTFLLALCSLTAAHAQKDSSDNILVYVTAAPTYMTHLYTVVNASPTPQSTLASKWFYGGGGGATLNFYKGTSLDLGLDFRGAPPFGTPGYGSALVGLKFGGHLSHSRFKPYGQLSLGWDEQKHTTGSGSYAYTDSETYFVFEFIGGVDYPLTRRIDLRIVDVGLGVTHAIDRNGTSTDSSPRVVSLNSGLVFKF